MTKKSNMAFAAETLLSIILPTDILEVCEVGKVGAPDKPCGEDARMLTQNCR